jgi:uroporphyrinogen-III synthase
MSGPVLAMCVGPVCASTARESGFARVFEPARARLGAMVHTLSTEVAAQRRATAVDDETVWLDGVDAVIGGQVLALTARERAVLDRLALRPGVVVPKAVLRDEIWGPDTGLHAVEVTVARLRERIAGHLEILALPRRGYRLVAASSARERPLTRRSG